MQGSLSKEIDWLEKRYEGIVIRTVMLLTSA